MALFQNSWCPRLLAFASLLLPLPFAQAGMVRTLDGADALEGDIRFEKGQFLIAPYGSPDKPVAIDVATIFQAVVRDSPAQAGSSLPRPTGDGRLPASLELIDIGTLARPSTAAYRDNSVFSLKSAGAGIGQERDAFGFVRQRIEGDGEISAQVTQIKDPSKVLVGIMIRASAEPDAAFVALLCGGGKLQMIHRTAGGQRAQSALIAPRQGLPAWIRLTRRGNNVIAHISANGQSWKQAAAESLAFDTTAHFGLAVCGQDRNELLGGYIDSVRIVPVASAHETPIPTELKEGLMLRTGTLLAGAAIHQADESIVRYSKHDRQNVAISAKSVARLIFVDLGAEAAAKIPAGRTGVLLKEGDFIEGEFRGVRSGRLQLSSVLFGNSSFERGNQARAVVLGDLGPARPAAIVRGTDGSIYMAKSIAIDKDRLMVEDELAGTFALARDQVASIVAGPGRLVFLSTIKPTAVEPAAHGSLPALTTGSSAAGMPITLAGTAVDHGIVMLSGTSASWKFAGPHRMFNYRVCVPSGVLPNAAVRFIILGDGKELKRTPPRTSLDDPISGTIQLQGVRTLTLKVECTDNTLPMPGLWAQCSLVK